MDIAHSFLIEGEYYWVQDTEPLVFHRGGVRVEEPAYRTPEVMQWWGDHFETMGSDLHRWDWNDDLKHLVVLEHIPKPSV